MSTQSTTSYHPEGTKAIAHFEVIERVGIGHFGSVWKARDTELDRTVALKIPRKGELDAEETEQFLREARAAAQARHPNIVSVHEVGREKDSVYIVSDFIDGASLGEWLTGRRLTPREAAELCAKLAEALHEAHEAGVVHRDLKPGNIMLDATGEPHITDFGLAKRESGEITMTVDGRVLGTPAYMSPEQARGKAHEADRRSDVYSLGVILYELLTGELPFRGESRMLIVQILHDEPPSPRRLNPNIPRDLETICLKCLEKTPGRRYQTAMELADELSRFVNGKPIQARPISRLERAVRACRRRPVVATLIALIVFVSGLGFAGILWQWRQTELARRDAAQVATEESRARQRAETAETKVTAQLDEIKTLRSKEKASYEAARQALYAARANIAQDAWEAGDIDQLRDALDPYQQEPDKHLRGFEWYYWKRIIGSELHTLSGHRMCALRVAVSPDGKWIAACGGNSSLGDWKEGRRQETTWGEVDVWEYETGRHVHRFVDLEGWDWAGLAFDLDSTLVAAARGKRVSMWDLTSGEQIVHLASTGRNSILGLGFDSDGQLLAYFQGENVVKAWSKSASWHPIAKLPDEVGSSRVAFSSGGRQLAWASKDHALHVMDLATERIVAKLEGHSARVLDIAFSKHGQRLASCDFEHNVKIWDLKDESLILSPPAAGAGILAFSLDGQRLAFASGLLSNEISVLTTEPGAKPVTLKGHSLPVLSLAFTPDSQGLVSGEASRGMFLPASSHGTLGPSGPMPAGAIKTWRIEAARTVRVLRAHADISQIRYSPDGKHQAWLCADHTIHLVDATTGQTAHVWKFDSSVSHIAFCDNGKLVMLRGRTLVDVRSGQPMGEIPKDKLAVGSFAIRPDGSQFARCSGKVQIIDLPQATPPTFLPDVEPVHCLVYSSDGNWLAASTGQFFLQPLAPPEAGETIIWDTREQEERRRLGGHAAAVTSVAFRPALGNQTVLATASSDGTVKIWDLGLDQPMRTLRGHIFPITGLAFSPDGWRLASAGGLTVNVWDLRTGIRLLEFSTPAERVEFKSVLFSPRGDQLAARCSDGSVCVWDSLGHQ